MASASVLWWLAIPVVATTAALVWAAWSSRPRRPVDMEQSVAAYERFKAAIERPGAGQARAGADRTAADGERQAGG